MARKKIITSESVTEGHPDKICDQISDAILDDIISKDSNSRVAVECMITFGKLFIAGEVTSTAEFNPEEIARNILKDIGYTDKKFGADYRTIEILVNIHEQSPDISQGVSENEEKEMGAGDQGMMFGYACNETEDYMPLPINLAHKLTKRLAEVRKEKIIDGLGPDGKSQVSVEYLDDKPNRVDTIIIAQQHIEDKNIEILRKEILEEVIKPVCGDLLDDNTKIFTNTTGKFVIGGPEGDVGLTGRKIIVDTYGGIGRHGGGCFSGKDPSKVDRSGAYAARYVAKNIIAAGLAEKCELQLSYAIGISKPISLNIECFGTNKIPEEEIEKLIIQNFDLTPKGIIKNLELLKPTYRKTATYGHFGRSDCDFSWERLDKVDSLKTALS